MWQSPSQRCRTMSCTAGRSDANSRVEANHPSGNSLTDTKWPMHRRRAYLIAAAAPSDTPQTGSGHGGPKCQAKPPNMHTMPWITPGWATTMNATIPSGAADRRPPATPAWPRATPWKEFQTMSATKAKTRTFRTSIGLPEAVRGEMIDLLNPPCRYARPVLADQAGPLERQGTGVLPAPPAVR